MESKLINRADRPKRLTPGEQRNRQTVSGLDTKNFYYRIVNDYGDRIAIFMQKGYTFVPKEGKIVGDKDISIADSKSSAVTFSKGGTVVYLMKFFMDLYLHDRAEIEKLADVLGADQKKKVQGAGDYGSVTMGSFKDGVKVS